MANSVHAIQDEEREYLLGSQTQTKQAFCGTGRVVLTCAFVVFGISFCSFLVVVMTRDTVELTVSSEANTGDDSAYARTYGKAGVATDAAQCSSIGRQILEKGGSSVDASIASMLCVGVHNPQSTGIAGSSFMLIYERPRNGTDKELVALNFRETAPRRSRADLFVNPPRHADLKSLEIAVFGELAGYWAAWQRYGRLPWAELFRPTIAMCENGFVVERALADELKSDRNQLRAWRNEGNMRPIFFQENGISYKFGDIMTRPQLARTLRRIAEGGAEELYSGALSLDILADLKELGSIIEADDLANYRVRWEEPMMTSLPNAGVHVATLGAPSGGPVLQFILQLFDGYDWTQAGDLLQYHRIAEAFKFAYAMKTRLGDPNFVNVTQILHNIADPEFINDTVARIDDSRTHDIDYYEPDIGFSVDGGTSSLSVYSPEGAAVVHTSSINGVFGSFRRGRRTGVIFNDGMDDFSTSDLPNGWDLPPSYANIIRPGKQPLSSMCPTLVFDDKHNVKLAVGGAGGAKITTAVANALWHTLYRHEDLGQGLLAPRIHHQLSPNTLTLEKHFSEKTAMFLRLLKGHEVDITSSIAVLQGIERICDENTESDVVTDTCHIRAVSDVRKGGMPDGF